jgi:hypothetical protein
MAHLESGGFINFSFQYLIMTEILGEENYMEVADFELSLSGSEMVVYSYCRTKEIGYFSGFDKAEWPYCQC